MTAVGLVGLLFAGGVTAYATGLVHEYRPPRLTAADYVGTWHDTFGGEIRFSADGTFTAKRIRDYPFEASDLTDHYAGHSGTGTWRSTAEQTALDPLVSLQFDDDNSRLADWEPLGTRSRSVVYYWIGDPDSGVWYRLLGRPSASDAPTTATASGRKNRSRSGTTAYSGRPLTSTSSGRGSSRPGPEGSGSRELYDDPSMVSPAPAGRSTRTDVMSDYLN